MLMWGFQLTVHINAHGIMHIVYLFQIFLSQELKECNTFLELQHG